MTYEEIEDRNEYLWTVKTDIAQKRYDRRKKERCDKCKKRTIIFIPTGVIFKSGRTGIYLCSRCGNKNGYTTIPVKL